MNWLEAMKPEAAATESVSKTPLGRKEFVRDGKVCKRPRAKNQYNGEEYLSIKGIQERYGLSRYTVDRLRKMDGFPAPLSIRGTDLTRWKVTELDAFVLVR